MTDLHDYWKKLGWGVGHQSRLVFRFLTDAAEFAKGGTILDAGAGHQRYRPFFSECLYLTQEHPAGIEFKRMQGITYDLVAPIDEMIPLIDGSLDAIINTSVVEHVRYPERFFAEAYRVLMPGGNLFVHVPFAYPEHEAPYDFQRPTRYGLLSWLEDAGFSGIQISPASSSTEAAMAFLQSSLEQDIFRGTPITPGGGVLRKAMSWARKRPLQLVGHAFIWLVVVVLVRALGIVARVVDRGPFPDSTYPVGWIVIATKPGTRRRAPTKSREAFLLDNALISP